ncbi:MAG: hypothetical protein KDI16_10445 [Halioglobus sp.]|nr:hypothetical protein [Halioglobus sp.]
MTTDVRGRRAILVPIDLHGVTRGALETLVRIARHLDRDVLAILLEDARLQRAAELPFAAEISLRGGVESSLQRQQLAHRHSRTCADALRWLRELAHSNRVALRFEDAVGVRWRAALEREGNPDLFFPARQRWLAHLPGRRTGSAAIRRLGAVVAQGDACASLLAATAAMVRGGLAQELYLIGRDPLPAETLRALHHPGLRLRQWTGFRGDADSIEKLICQSPCDLLLLPRSSLQAIAPDHLESALESSGSQIFVVE